MLGWRPCDWEPLTYRELLISHDAYLLDKWDRASLQAMQVHNLHLSVMTFGSKKRPPFRSFTDFHPYRAKKRRGLKITPANFGILRQVGNLMVKGRR